MEDIRRAWEGIGTRYDSESGNSDFRGDGRRETSLEKLRRKYLWFSRMGFIFMFVAPCSFLAARFMTMDDFCIVALIFVLYFGVCSSMDYWLYKGISSIDCYRMTVKEVVEKAFYYRKKHLQFIAILIPFALLCVGALGYALRGEPFLIFGMVFGGIVGGVMGYRQYLEFMGEYRKLKE